MTAEEREAVVREINRCFEDALREAWPGFDPPLASWDVPRWRKAIETAQATHDLAGELEELHESARDLESEVSELRQRVRRAELIARRPST